MDSEYSDQPTTAIGEDGKVFAERVETLRDYTPPPWLVALLRRRHVPVPYRAATRAVLILVVPIAVGFALGRPETGALVSIGGLPVVLADDGGAYRRRAFRLGAAVVAAAAGYVPGLLVRDSPVPAAAVILALAVVSVPLGKAGKSSGPVGMLLLVFGVIGTAEHFVDIGIAAMLVAFVAGAGWGLVVGLAGWIVRPTAPERDAVAKVFVELAVLLDADDPAVARAARHQVTVALNAAYDRLLTARTWISSRHSVYRSLLTLLSQATPVVEACTAAVTAGERAPRAVVDHMTRVAAAVLADTELPEPPERQATDSPHVTAVHDGMRRMVGGRQRGPSAPPSARSWLRARRAELSLDRVTANAVLRLGVCVALAEVAGALLPTRNIHWVTLTVAIVLRPELGSVFGRTVLRAAGTVAGVAVGAVVLFAEPGGWLLVVLAAAFAAGIAVGKALNYGILSAAMTPLIIVQLDIQNMDDPTVLTERLVHTVIGCLIVLVAGYWLWPGSLRPRVGMRVAHTMDAVAEYVDRGLRPVVDDSGVMARSRARRRAYRALAELRTAFSQVIVEPSPAGRQALAWWPVIVGLERIVDAVTAVVVRVRGGAEECDNAQVEGLLDAIDELRDAVREGREPVVIRLPGNDGIDEVTDQLRLVFDAMRGPAIR